MMNGKHKKQIQQVLLWSMAVVMFIALFIMPFIKLAFEGQRTFTVTVFNLLFSNLPVGDTVLSLPILARIFSLLTIVGIGIGVWFLYKRNMRWSGFFFLVTSVCTIGASISISMFGTALQQNSAVNELTTSLQSGFWLLFLLGTATGLLALWIWHYEKLFQYLFFFFSTISVLSVAVITGYMIFLGAPAIAKIGLFNFLFNTVWHPTFQTPSFGIGAMILTTIYGTLGAILIGVPIGVLTAIFLAEIAPRWMVKIFRPCIQLLAGIPSVVYGFFGMMLIVPAVRDIFHVPVGDSLFSVIIILSIMILPTIVSISETALRAVPETYKEASLATGATHIQSIFKVILPAARSGILASVILGVGRAIGETMAVIMVAGNVVNMPTLLEPVRPLTAGIVLEMSYAADLHREALFGIALVLFVFIMLVNIAFRIISKKAGDQFEGKI